jgi:hypothetical protein
MSSGGDRLAIFVDYLRTAALDGGISPSSRAQRSAQAIACGRDGLLALQDIERAADGLGVRLVLRARRVFGL